MADTDVTNVVIFDVIRALIRVAFNQNHNAVFIRSTEKAFYYIQSSEIQENIVDI